MKPILKTALMAYRPLYLNGLLLDGQYKLPKADPTDAAVAPRARRRALLAALTHIVFHPRSK
jgi:hypothetical protein